jgi:hypothetical protein
MILRIYGVPFTSDNNKEDHKGWIISIGYDPHESEDNQLGNLRFVIETFFHILS